MRAKFIFSEGGFFGICFTEFPKGIPGYTDSNGWMMYSNGEL